MKTFWKGRGVLVVAWLSVFKNLGTIYENVTKVYQNLCQTSVENVHSKRDVVLIKIP